MPDFGPLIVASELEQHLSDPDWQVVDCRFDLMNPDAGSRQWLEAHIPGAAYAHLDDDLAGSVTENSGRHPLPAVDDICETLGRLGIGTDSTVIVYDDSGGAIAARLWWLLRWLGHRRVAVLDGGFTAWTAGKRPVESGETQVARRDFEGNPRASLVLTTEEIIATADVASLRLVDARAGARFRGETEPIDAVAGHVPGARNLPFSEVLGPDGHWRTAEEQRETWQRVLGGDLETPWCAMCGSGVTACHLAVSGAVAGLPEPRIYIGSWSEWIRDPNRPVGKGTPGP